MLVDPHSGSHLRRQPSSHSGVIQLGGNTPNKVDSSPTSFVHSTLLCSCRYARIVLLCATQPTAYYSSQVILLSQWAGSSQAHHCGAGKDLGTIAHQFPFEPLQYQATNLRLPFQEGIKMLQEAGWDVSQHIWFHTRLQLHYSPADSASINILKHS